MSSTDDGRAPKTEPKGNTINDTSRRPVVSIGDDTLVRRISVNIVGGPMDGESCRVVGESLTIGRGEENDLMVPLDMSVSTRHARIVREGGNVWLEDLGSTNGTFIGEKKIEERTLIGHGTVFVVGRTRVELESR